MKKVPMTIDEHLEQAVELRKAIKILQAAIISLQGSQRKDSPVMRKLSHAIKDLNDVRNNLDDEWNALPQNQAWGRHGDIYYGTPNFLK